MNNVEKIEPTGLFTNYIYKAIPLAFDESMSYYETVCGLLSYLKDTVIPALNNNADAIIEVQNLMTELQNYVNNYFDNLDVQQEINNKLDEMVESGELESLIADFIIGGKGQVKYIFPQSTSITTEFNIIQAYEKNIIIDVGNSYDYQSLKDTLEKYQISHLDIVIISHFHTDHVGNFTNLVNDNYIDEETDIYLPPFNQSVWAENSAYNQYLETMQTINENNLSYTIPIEGQILTINENFTIKFLNCNDTYYIDNNISDDYNNGSMMCLVKHFQINSLYTGDCYPVVINRYYNLNKLPSTIHLFKIGHHGMMGSSSTILPLTNDTNIINSVQIIGINDIKEGKASYDSIGREYYNISDLFVTAYNKNNIEFSSFINSLNLLNGFNGGSDNLNSVNKEIYVDIVNATNTQNGSQNNPFSNLHQALGFIDRNIGINYIINISNGEYTIPYQNSSGCKANICNTNNTIQIIGEDEENTILDYSIFIKNSQNVKISKIQIKNIGVNSGISIENSTVELSDIIYNKHENQANIQRAIDIKKSNVIIKNTSITNARFGIHSENSILDIDTINFDIISNDCFRFVKDIIKNISNITYTENSGEPLADPVNDENKAFFLNGFPLFSGEATYGNNMTLLTRSDFFRYIEVVYSVHGFIGSVKVPISRSNTAYPAINTNHISGSGGFLLYSTRINFGANKNGNFSYSRKYEYKTSDSSIAFFENFFSK